MPSLVTAPSLIILHSMFESGMNFCPSAFYGLFDNKARNGIRKFECTIAGAPVLKTFYHDSS
jgi:hypothetical protein